MRSLVASPLVFIAVAAASGCGGIVNSSDAGTGTDAGTKPDAPITTSDGGAPPPFDAGTFCSGTAPRLMVNGSEVPVINVSGKAFALNCCDSAEVLVASAAFQAMLAVLWRAPALSSAATIDLANPPSGFGIELDLGCDPGVTSCANGGGEERYTDGFSGTLSYTLSSSGPTSSYCLSVSESPSSPHLVVHSLQLYAPDVTSSF